MIISKDETFKVKVDNSYQDEESAAISDRKLWLKERKRAVHPLVSCSISAPDNRAEEIGNVAVVQALLSIVTCH